MMSDQVKDRGGLISDTLLISAAPALAYGVAYFFEAGYLANYAIPEFFISVSLERFFYALSTIIAIYVVLINLLDPLFVFFPKKFMTINVSHYLFFLLLFLPILSGGIGLFHKGFGWYNLTMLMVGIFGIFFVFILPAVGKKNVREYIEALNHNEEFDNGLRQKSLTSRLVNTKWGGVYIASLIILLIIPISSKLLGSYIAYKERNYLVAKFDGTDYALIRSYGDNNLFVDFHRKWKTLYSSDPVFGSQVVIKKVSEQPLIFAHIKIVADEE